MKTTFNIPAERIKAKQQSSRVAFVNAPAMRNTGFTSVLHNANQSLNHIKI